MSDRVDNEIEKLGKDEVELFNCFRSKLEDCLLEDPNIFSGIPLNPKSPSFKEEYQEFEKIILLRLSETDLELENLVFAGKFIQLYNMYSALKKPVHHESQYEKSERKYEKSERKGKLHPEDKKFRDWKNEKSKLVEENLNLRREINDLKKKVREEKVRKEEKE